MKYFIPTYKQAIEICNMHNNLNFYETKFYFNKNGDVIFDELNNYDYLISIFNYRLTTPTMFETPIKHSDIKAHEMRGLCFIFNKNGSLYNRFILLRKFFNINQCEDVLYNNLKNEKIKEISYKEDGSLISFIKLPNNKIIAKTKGSFISVQALNAQKIFNENTYIQKFVNYCIDNNIVSIFEYVSPSNQIVLRYDKSDLILIKLRNNSTGEYIDIKEISQELLSNISIVKTVENLTLDDLIEKCKKDKGYEGFVVLFENGKMIKLKLFEYCNIHRLHTEYLYREDYIISLIIKDDIDDIICQLEKDDERKSIILDLIKIVNHYINRNYKGTTELLNTYDNSKKDFYLKNKNSPFIYFAMLVLNQNKDLLTTIENLILKDTYFLKKAKEWIIEEKKLMT